MERLSAFDFSDTVDSCLLPIWFLHLSKELCDFPMDDSYIIMEFVQKETN